MQSTNNKYTSNEPRLTHVAQRACHRLASGKGWSAPQPSESCQPACLFNIAEDPGEHKDMATIERGLVAKMLARFKELELEYHPRVVPPPKLGAAFCAAANAHSGFTAPYCAYAPAGSDGCP